MAAAGAQPTSVEECVVFIDELSYKTPFGVFKDIESECLLLYAPQCRLSNQCTKDLEANWDVSAQFLIS